jgi:hypothetical protein
MGLGNGARSMQPLMYDQPQPTCGRIQNNSAERGGADHHRPEKDCLAKPPVWIGREHCLILPARTLASSILLKPASRPAPRGFDFTRWGDRPEAGGPRPYFGADRGVYRLDGGLKRPRSAEPAGFSVPFLAPILLDAAEVA